jgi:cysteine desulfurase
LDLVYLDHAALTPCEPAAQQAMVELLAAPLAHPDAAHAPARRVRSRIERARGEVADYLGCESFELRFCPSGSAALGAAIELATASRSGSIVSVATEHSSVLDHLRPHHGRLELLPLVAGDIDYAAAAGVLAGAEIVVLSALNHELGTTPHLSALFQLAPRAVWVIDAVQASAWLDLAECLRSVALVAVSSQKMGGPPGVGALRVPKALAGAAASLQTGDSTRDSLAIVGFGAACRARNAQREDALLRVRPLAQRLFDGLGAARPGVVRNGNGVWAGPILNVAWPDLAGRAIEHILDLEGVAIARTSACRQRYDDVSSIVTAAYPDEPWRARGATRWSLGWHTTQAEIDEAIARFQARFGRT